MQDGRESSLQSQPAMSQGKAIAPPETSLRHIAGYTEPSSAEPEVSAALSASSQLRKVCWTAQDDKDGTTKETKETARVFHVSYTVRAGGGILAFCAGMINAVAFHALGRFVSHMTGTFTRVGLGLEDSGEVDAGDSMLLVVSFVAGSIFTGFLIAKDDIHFGLALYGLCLLTESFLLICVTLAYKENVARYLAAAACGLQNGMATHWGGAVVRTTHVTGLFTDIGLMIGRLTSLLCRKRCRTSLDGADLAYVADDLSKMSVLVLIAVSFFLGVFVGAHVYNTMKQSAFLIPAGITGVLGIAYSTYRVFFLKQKLFSDAEMELIDVPAEMHEVVESHEAAELDSLQDDGMNECGNVRSGSKMSTGSKRSSNVRSGSKERSTKQGTVVSVSREYATILESSHVGLDLHSHGRLPSKASVHRSDATTTTDVAHLC